MLLMLLASLGFAEPSDHTLLYYNARMALREGKPLEAAKLWLLRNSLADATQTVSPHDPDFHSVTWVALGELGVCPDGHANDTMGAGLWPLGMHNWVLRNMSRSKKAKPPRPFDAFQVGRQQRYVSITDVLSASELKEVDLFRGVCARQRLVMLSAGEMITAKLSDRQVASRILLHLLYRAEETMDPSMVSGRSVLAARRFDLHLQLTALAAREARQELREQSRQGRMLGLSRESVEMMRNEAQPYTFSDTSPPAQILRESLHWPVEEWMALSSDRRHFVFEHARNYTREDDILDDIALGVIDELIDQGKGEEVRTWIGLLRSDPKTVWGGSRGAALLALDEEAGFGERSVISLHRGVAQLERGDLAGSLRSFAYALQSASTSNESDDVERLARRWLGYVSSQFEITDELLITLQQLLPARDYSVILEDLMWRAAFHADDPSFQRGIRNQPSRGAIMRRIDLLGPLAKGDIGRFSTMLRTGLQKSPSETFRFMDQLLERLEREDADIRTAQIPTLRNLRTMLEPIANDPDGSRRMMRTTAELLSRSQALLEGVGGLGEGTAGDRARSLDPSGAVFAGSVRLAPADTLPWPFRETQSPSPSAFIPLDIKPVEWRRPDGELAFGWSIGG